MEAMQTAVFNELSDAKKKKTILKGLVKLAQTDAQTHTEELVIDYKGVKCVCPKSEIDHNVKYKSLISFIGNEIDFIVTKVHRETNSCVISRAKAQDITAPATLEKLEDGECFNGTIINILPYGAYVEVDGVTGLLKNGDFAEDFTSVRDVRHVRDKVMVKLRGKSKNGNLLFEAVKKYISPTAVRKEDLEVGQIVFGVVRSKQPWGIFVNVAPGLDALVDSEFVDIEEDQKVSVKIKTIKNDGDKLKVRGKIVSVL